MQVPGSVWVWLPGGEKLYRELGSVRDVELQCVSMAL